MPSILLRFILALLSLALSWSTAAAQAVSFPDLGSTLPAHENATYLDLARMVIPDLGPGQDGFYHGGPPISMRHIEGPDSGGSPPEASSLPSAAALAIRAGGKDRLAMLYDLGDASDSAEGYAVLALYDVTGAPKLLDAVNVAVDRSTYFRDPGKLTVADGDDVLIAMSTHFNSSQGYVATPLIMVRNDRFKLIDMIHTFDETLCAYKRTQEIAFQPVADEPFTAIRATVTEAIVPTGETCDEPPPQASSHRISVTYRWDKQASLYVRDSDAFDRLSAENANRF
jgi:hypothetical protein